MRIALAVTLTLAVTAAAGAQTIGTFSWNVAPYGSVITVTITQVGSLFRLEGFEAQCGGNLSLPVHGVAIPQANGSIFFGMTSITELGSGLHTRAYINPAVSLSGTYADNAGNFNQPFVFNPGNTCPGGPRTGPISGANPRDGADTAALAAEMAALQARLAALEAKQQ